MSNVAIPLGTETGRKVLKLLSGFAVIEFDHIKKRPPARVAYKKTGEHDAYGQRARRGKSCSKQRERSSVTVIIDDSDDAQSLTEYQMRQRSGALGILFIIV